MDAISSHSGGPQPDLPTAVATGSAPSWDDLQLAHASLPEIDLDAVDCSLVFLARHLRLPLLVDATSAGANASLLHRLARAAQQGGAALAIMLEPRPSAEDGEGSALTAARDVAPGAILIGAIEASQLLQAQGEFQPNLAAAQAEMRAAGAAALAVQLDYLQVAARSGGTLRAHGLAGAATALSDSLGLPLIVRAGDGGLTREEAQRLKDCGVAGLDAGGRDRSSLAGGAPAFQSWGVPAAASVLNAAATGLPVIAGCGVRHGLDAAKAIAAGATLVAVGEPLLQAAREGGEAASGWIEQFEAELRAAMFLTGSRTLPDLRRQRPVILGATLEWLKQQDT